ncbi:hypothetical protein M0638_27655 [Roseomonas sp. NAR14]|uniref:Uncharacterized protein n=1 Tax=Roseomonas acroporae TaxID=2937791 RepID=A0A9X1YC98_9PROT|nr:hypothetical protein [Roseomonas acroporae]MCK8788134.1 hypothetical protein [Roseomonas acroporae]
MSSVTNGRLMARLDRLDGGGSAPWNGVPRVGWWRWRNRSRRRWPEAVAEAYAHSLAADDPEAHAVVRRASDEDLRWEINRLIRKWGRWTPAMEARTPPGPSEEECEALKAELLASVQARRGVAVSESVA